MVKTNIEKVFIGAGAEALVTLPSDLRFYLTGFSSSFGCVVTDGSGTVFYTDSRYLEAAENSLKGSGVTVKEYKKGRTLPDLLTGYKSIALPLEKTSAEDYLNLKSRGFDIKDSTPSFRKAIAVKSADELENISLACKAADGAFLDLLSLIKEGMTENEVAALIEYLMRKHGASGTSFETICAFGSNASVPHHETGLRKLRFGDEVLLDFGCKVNGYCSDCTRTFLFGDDGQHGEFKSVYASVLQAHMLVKGEFKSGMTGKEGDAIARNYLKSRGLDQFFTHSLGHSLGVNIHEYPNLSPSCEEIFTDGMVFSDEPGVYFPAKSGVRIEDTVTLENGRIKSLTNTDKNLIIL